MEQKTIVIVGAGITGVSAAEWLRRDGWNTLLIDPVEPGDRGQTSFGNAGLIARTCGGLSAMASTRWRGGVGPRPDAGSTR